MRKEKYIKTEKRNGNTYFRVYIHYGEDKVYSKSFAANDYQSETQALNAACKHRDLMRAELVTHGIPDYQSVTVQYLFDEYEQLYVNREGTHTLHSWYFNKFIAPQYGNTDIQKITAREVMVCLNSAVYSCTDEALMKIRSIWSEIFKMARLDRAVMVNPMEEVIVPPSQKAAKRKNQYCSPEDVDRICDYLENEKTAKTYRELFDQKIILYIIRFIQATGCRPAEAFAISRKTSYDFDRKIIHIDKQFGTDKDGPAIVKPKARSIRDIPMTETAEEVLRKAEKLSDHEYIFQTFEGNFQDSGSVGTILGRASKATGIDFHLYMLRHMMATYLIKETGDIRATMEIMGHTGQTAAQSLDYARSTPENKRRLMEKCENARKCS